MAIGRRIAFVGAGAVGGYVGAGIANAGHDVTLIDPWPEHIERIKREGMLLGGTEGERRVRVAALHITEAQRLAARPIDLAFICMKLYDTAWASALIKPYLAPTGVVVTMQNSLVEEQVAGIVGWGRTLGCIASMIAVEAVAPGHIVRTQLPGGAGYTVFRVGEMTGLATERAQAIAALLRCVDSAKVTTNLWGERWSKLVANTMTTGLCGVLGMSLNAMTEWAPSRRIQVKLAAEAIRIGIALGFELENIRGMEAERWLAAAQGEPGAFAQVEAAMLAATKRRTGEGRSGTAQDLAKGRRTEIEFMNGFVAAKGEEAGIAAPTHAAVTALVQRIERGELQPAAELVEQL
ncbi:MAG: 2-dehydropantoate 2-reductase [Burkholderiales bacterium]|nr:2-dehydropantoate 2-reductase [Burkholderiales bacterium]